MGLCPCAGDFTHGSPKLGESMMALADYAFSEGFKDDCVLAFPKCVVDIDQRIEFIDRIFSNDFQRALCWAFGQARGRLAVALYYYLTDITERGRASEIRGLLRAYRREGVGAARGGNEPRQPQMTPRRPGRKPGDGSFRSDECLLDIMHMLLESGQADSKSDAARAVAPRAKGNSEKAKVDRLRSKYRRKYESETA
jgi:hypothetical protein